MKIIYCHNSYQIRSGEDVARDFAAELLRNAGHEVVDFGPCNTEISQYGWAERSMMPLRIVHSGPQQQELMQALVKRRPDVAVVQNVFPLLSPAVYYTLLKANIPTIQLAFNYRMFCLNGQFYTRGKICERCLTGSFVNGVMRRCLRQSYPVSAMYALSLGIHRMLHTWRKCVDAFVAPDEFLRNKLVEGGVPFERTHVLSNPFRSRRKAMKYEHDGYGLFVGRWIRPKGIFTLLDAALITGHRVPIHIVGEGEDEDKVRAHRAVQQGKVELFGTVYGADLDRLLERAAFVVVPSEWYDNLPMIVCQAFDAGRPVLASRINGIPEYVRHEINGLLFEPGQPEELAAGMCRLLEEPGLAARLSEQARKTAVEELAPEVWSAGFDEILERVRKTQARKSGSAP